MNFQKKLTLSFTVISVLSMAITGGVSYFFASDIVKKQAIFNLTKELEAVKGSIEIVAKDNAARIASQMSYWGPAITSQLSVKEDTGDMLLDGNSLKDHKAIDKVSKELGGVATIFIRDEKGYRRYTTSIKNQDGSRAVNTYLPSDSAQVKRLDEGKNFIGRAKLLGTSYYVAYEPIKKDNKVVGAFFIGSRDFSIGSIKDHLKEIKLLETGYFYIMDSAGTLVLHPSMEGKNVLADTDVDGQPIFKMIIEQKQGTIKYRWLNHQTKQVQDKIALFNFFPEEDWYLAASLNEAEVMSGVVQLRWTLFFISSIMVVLMLIATVLFGRSVARELKAVSAMLSDSSVRVEKGGADLSSVSEQLAQASIQQAASLQETVSAIDEINAMVKRNLEGTDSVETLSRNMSDSAKSGQEILGVLKNAIESISNKNSELDNEVKSNNQEMENITQVISQIEQRTKVIHEIVFQTKLLSFNASVEAARAGEQGKGFSVVAHEVGKLAQMSGNAASEIQKNLEESRRQVEQIVKNAQGKMAILTQEAESETRKGVEVSVLVQSVFAKLIDQIEMVNSSIQNISQASKEQGVGIDEIGKAANELDKVTQENSSVAQTIKSLAAILNNDAIELEHAVNTLRVFLNGNSELENDNMNNAEEEPKINIHKMERKSA